MRRDPAAGDHRLGVELRALRPEVGDVEPGVGVRENLREPGRGAAGAAGAGSAARDAAAAQSQATPQGRDSEPPALHQLRLLGRRRLRSAGSGTRRAIGRPSMLSGTARPSSAQHRRRDVQAAQLAELRSRRRAAPDGEKQRAHRGLPAAVAVRAVHRRRARGLDRQTDRRDHDHVAEARVARVQLARRLLARPGLEPEPARDGDRALDESRPCLSRRATVAIPPAPEHLALHARRCAEPPRRSMRRRTGAMPWSETISSVVCAKAPLASSAGDQRPERLRPARAAHAARRASPTRCGGPLRRRPGTRR